ncbi:FCD domain-containing protein [uncultured Albimonas sp.]|uniref:FadR/GntR family transcriptional regulator n=1 Tax=uncultured Albimonas sp. TaxID=1331701 RepID=UPI0030EE6E9C
MATTAEGVPAPSFQEGCLVKLNPIAVSRPAEQLANSLKERIVEGAIPQGHSFKEQELVDLSGLSRSSVREAMRLLESWGLVESRRGRNGGYVATRGGIEPLAASLDIYMRSGEAEVAELMEILEIIEPGLAALAARRRTEADLAAMRAALAELASETDSDRFVRKNHAWHMALARASRNAVLGAVHEALGPALIDPRLEGFADAGIRSQVLHIARRIIEAIEAGDAEAARRRMARHVTAYRETVEARLRG